MLGVLITLGGTFFPLFEKSLLYRLSGNFPEVSGTGARRDGGSVRTRSGELTELLLPKEKRRE